MSAMKSFVYESSDEESMGLSCYQKHFFICGMDQMMFEFCSAPSNATANESIQEKLERPVSNLSAGEVAAVVMNKRLVDDNYIVNLVNNNYIMLI